MNIKEVITEYKYYFILSYLLGIFGIILSFHYNFDNIKMILYYTMVIFALTTPILAIIFHNLFKYNNETKNYYLEVDIHNLNVNHSKLIDNSIIIKYVNFTRSVGIIALFVVPILVGAYNYNSLSSNASNQYPLLITTVIVMTLFYTDSIRKQLYNENFLTVKYVLMGAVLLNFILSTEYGSFLLNKILTYVLSNLPDSFTVLIAIIMLGVGLAALSFGYCSILPDSKIRKNMKRNGEGFFISSILSMMSVIVLYITSILKDYIDFTPLISLDIFSMNFILLNIYSLGLILILSCVSYATYCLIKCSILSLKELKLFEDYI